MLLLNITVVYEDDYFKTLWVVDTGILEAAKKVNTFNSEHSTQIKIVGATQIPDVKFTKEDRDQLEEAGIHTTLDDFIYED